MVGLELGADDYVAKPFSPRELFARLRAVLAPGEPRRGGEQLSVGDIAIDVRRARCAVGGKRGRAHRHRVRHPRRARSAGRAASSLATRCSPKRGAATWRWASARSTCTFSPAAEARRRPARPKQIKTVRGVGYVLAKERP